MKLKPYPEYKDSGVPWLGQIPAHWELHRGKWLFRKMERPVRPQDEVVTCFRDGTVTLRRNRRTRGFTESLKEIGYQGIRKGDLVIHQMDAFAGAVGVSDSDGKGTPVYSVCLPKRNLNTCYYAHIVREMSRSRYIMSLAKGIRERSTDFRFDTFASLTLIVPPHQEQTQIARFLDWKTAQINKFIRNKRRLIELLKEQKQNIINQAVTRGLDPNVKLKPSGVEWIGDIPEHWEIRRLKSFSRINSGQVNPQKDKYERMTLIAPNHIESQSGRLIYTQTCGEQGVISNKYFVKKGQLLYSKIRPALRKAIIAPADCLCSADMYGIEFDANSMIVEYALLTFLSNYFTKYTTDCSMRVAMPKINREALGITYIAVPPLAEQLHILNYAREETLLIEETITRAEREIELMQEYRTRLISDVVTGQVDVRMIEVPEVVVEELLDLEEEPTEAMDDELEAGEEE